MEAQVGEVFRRLGRIETALGLRAETMLADERTVPSDHLDASEEIDR